MLELISGFETELIETEKLSVALVFPNKAPSACDEESLTPIVSWWNMGPVVCFWRDMVLNHVGIDLGLRPDCFNYCRADMAGDFQAASN